MLNLVYGKSFLKSAKKLPAKQQQKLAGLLELLSDQPFNPSLHTKPLSGGLVGFYSFRITRDWRVIFQFISANEVKLIIVGHRKDIYEKI